MSRFDPDPDKPYGTCESCGEDLLTREDTHTHLSKTHDSGGSSHTVRIVNRTRAERIKDELERLADGAVSSFIDDAWDLVDRNGITKEEITAAIRQINVDFEDAWRESDE